MHGWSAWLECATPCNACMLHVLAGTSLPSMHMSSLARSLPPPPPRPRLPPLQPFEFIVGQPVTGAAVRHAHVLPTPWNLVDGCSTRRAGTFYNLIRIGCTSHFHLPRVTWTLASRHPTLTRPT